MEGNFIIKDVISKAEDFAEEVYDRTRRVLPTTARACLISTFMEDGIRMWVQWSDQRDYMDRSWGCGSFVGTMFVLINLVGQIGGCAMVLLRKKVPTACGILFFIVVLQAFAYFMFSDTPLLIRNVALIGALMLVLAETLVEPRSLLAGLPRLGEHHKKHCLQLAGRCLLAFMFSTLIRFESSFRQILQNILGGILMVLVTIGYKTKLCSLILVLLLMIPNFYNNCWWMNSDYKLKRDIMKYNFFQTLSVIGGLLMVVYLGPGGVSIDEHKKQW